MSLLKNNYFSSAFLALTVLIAGCQTNIPGQPMPNPKRIIAQAEKKEADAKRKSLEAMCMNYDVEIDDFTIVNPPEVEMNSALNEIIRAISSAQPTRKANLSRRVFPKILYTVNIEVENASKSYAELKSVGSCYLIDKTGFFISTYHVMDSAINGAVNGKNSKVVIFYDPESGIATTATALIYSKKYDILLGKIEPNIDLDVDIIDFADDVIPPNGFVVAACYENNEYRNKALFQCIGKSGKFIAKKNQYEFIQDEAVKVEGVFDHLGIKPIGLKLFGIINSRDTNLKPFHQLFISHDNIPEEGEGGDSGSGVFTLDGHLYGLMAVISKPENNPFHLQLHGTVVARPIITMIQEYQARLTREMPQVTTSTSR